LVTKQYQKLFGAKNKRKPGRKPLSQELINAIVTMKMKNPRFGTPRIAQQINLVFGTDITRDQVRHVLLKQNKPTGGGSGPSWLTFLGHTKDSLWSVDFFKCHSATLKSFWVMVVIDQFSRRIVGFGINYGPPDGISACRMFNTATSGQSFPRYLSSDNDPLFNFHRWEANLRIREIETVKSIPHVPLSHPFVERVIGTIRREFLDHVLFVSETDLCNKLEQFKIFYNEQRTHQGINGRTPVMNDSETKKTPEKLPLYQWKRHCRGLFQLPAVL
jgi:putative transposase